MTSTEWLAYFRQNQRDRLPVAWDEPVAVTPATASVVAHSLARFQLGKSSDGTHLQRVAYRHVRREGDENAAGAIALLIREEQEHARLMGKTLERLGVRLLRRHWTDWMFRHVRRRFELSKTLSILLMGEVVALKYYSTIRNGTDDPVLQRICDQILHDEKFHLRFHCEYLHHRITQHPPIYRRFVWWSLSFLFAITNAVVAWDHQEALTALGCTTENFVEDSWRNFAAARQAILHGTAFVWSRDLSRVSAPVTKTSQRTKLQRLYSLSLQTCRALLA